MTKVSGRAILSRLIILFVLAAILPLHCSKSEKAETPKGTVTNFDTPVADTTTPPWLEPSRQWPDTLRWAMDSTWEMTVDGLFLRTRMKAWKVLLGGERVEDHPLSCVMETTLRPVPRWEDVRGLKADSVVFYDPVRSKRIPSLRMLSSRRTHLEGTLRTGFSSDAAVSITVDLDEGQPLEPTAYFTWDKRTIIVTVPAIPVSFLTELERDKELSLPEWPEP